MSVATIKRMPATTESSVGPLSDENRRELSDVRDRLRPIRRAAHVAVFNGWITASLALLSLPFAFFSYAGLAMSIVMAVVAFNEFRGRNRLLEFAPSGATLLGWNQVALLTAIVIYCAWALYANLAGPSILATDPQTRALVEESLGSVSAIESLARQIVILVYGSVIVLTLLFQGGNALYYFSRRKHVEQLLAQTPDWVLDLHRAA